MKYYWLLFEILEICLSDVSHLDAIALGEMSLDPAKLVDGIPDPPYNYAQKQGEDDPYENTHPQAGALYGLPGVRAGLFPGIL